MEATQSKRVTDEWEVVAKDGRDLYEMLEEAFADLGWVYVDNPDRPDLVIYVADVDEAKHRVYVNYTYEFPGSTMVWDGYGSPCVEIARYSPDSMWDIEQTYIDYDERVWYGEDGKPYPIDEFIQVVASDYAAEECETIEEAARETAEEILAYEYGIEEYDEEEE